MQKREVIQMVVDGKKPPYVPWSFWFTGDAHQKLVQHYGTQDLGSIINDHMIFLWGAGGAMVDIGNHKVRDVWNVVWDRSQDADIGVIEGLVLPDADLSSFHTPDPLDPRSFETLKKLGNEWRPDMYRIFSIGFSLYERAWTLRGMENLMMDFYDNPDFVKALLRRIADYNIAQLREAAQYDVDAIYFGDDWGQQHGLQMGYGLWKEFIYPELKRMYGAAHDAGKKVFIHSCGDVDELFDDLIGIGLNCFNPFQPEVMDVASLVPRYRGRLAFHGGLSTQKTLPYGTVEEVRRESRRLLELGRDGGYIFAPAHAVEGDVPIENLVAFIEEANRQRQV